MSVRLQNISSHRKKDTQDVNNSAGTPITTMNEEEIIQLEDSDENINHEDELSVCSLGNSKYINNSFSLEKTSTGR
jgi:hypothetical protein